MSAVVKVSNVHKSFGPLKVLTGSRLPWRAARWRR